MNKKLIWTVILTVMITSIMTTLVAVFMIFPLMEEKEKEAVPTEEQAVLTNEDTDDEKKDLPSQKDETVEDEKIQIDQSDYDYLMSIYDKYEQVEALEEYIRDNYYLDVEDVDFMSSIMKGLFEALDDPYSQYFTKEEYESYTQSASGNYEGIGVVVAPGEDGFITVVSPIDNSPGFEAGLETNDKILKVDGIEYSADELQEAVLNIRGPADSTVIITIRRDIEIIEIPVVRGKITLQAANSEVLEDEIGLLRLVSFDQDSAEEFERELNLLLEADVKGLIIDLRSNGGGYLDQCLEITDRLIGEGVIVSTKDNQGRVEVSSSDATKLEIPMVILVNGGSASASEILTGAVKDNEEGIIIGTTTFGKGLVQTMRPLPTFDNAGFKLTIKQYFTPDDHYIHGTGIEPNIVIENDDDDSVDEQLEKAKEVLKDQM